MKKIMWTKPEREAVLAVAVDLFTRDNYSAFEAVKQAQNTLPFARHRNFASHSAANDLVKEIKARAYKVVPIPKDVGLPIPPSSMPSEPPNKQPEPTVIGTIDDLVQAIAKRIAATLKHEIAVAVKELEHEFHVPKHNGEYATTGTKRPRVIVIGLLGDQVHAINNEFKDTYDLKFIDTDRAMGLSPPDADAYLLMKNFINHPLYHKYQGFPNHVLIDGGMTALRTWLYIKGKELLA
jgi:hypothetical protein